MNYTVIKNIEVNSANALNGFYIQSLPITAIGGFVHSLFVNQQNPTKKIDDYSFAIIVHHYEDDKIGMSRKIKYRKNDVPSETRFDHSIIIDKLCNFKISLIIKSEKFFEKKDLQKLLENKKLAGGTISPIPIQNIVQPNFDSDNHLLESLICFSGADMIISDNYKAVEKQMNDNEDVLDTILSIAKTDFRSRPVVMGYAKLKKAYSENTRNNYDIYYSEPVVGLIKYLNIGTVINCQKSDDDYLIHHSIFFKFESIENLIILKGN